MGLVLTSILVLETLYIFSVDKSLKLVPLKVKELDSIVHVNFVLHDTEVTPDDLDQLFSNDVRLTYDEQNLTDCGII